MVAPPSDVGSGLPSSHDAPEPGRGALFERTHCIAVGDLHKVVLIVVLMPLPAVPPLLPMLPPLPPPPGPPLSGLGHLHVNPGLLGKD